jgi:hypothetical protein
MKMSVARLPETIVTDSVRLIVDDLRGGSSTLDTYKIKLSQQSCRALLAGLNPGMAVTENCAESLKRIRGGKTQTGTTMFDRVWSPLASKYFEWPEEMERFVTGEAFFTLPSLHPAYGSLPQFPAHVKKVFLPLSKQLLQAMEYMQVNRLLTSTNDSLTNSETASLEQFQFQQHISSISICCEAIRNLVISTRTNMLEKTKIPVPDRRAIIGDVILPDHLFGQKIEAYTKPPAPEVSTQRALSQLSSTVRQMYRGSQRGVLRGRSSRAPGLSRRPTEGSHRSTTATTVSRPRPATSTGQRNPRYPYRGSTANRRV